MTNLEGGLFLTGKYLACIQLIAPLSYQTVVLGTQISKALNMQKMLLFVWNDTFLEKCLPFLCVGAFPTGTVSLVVWEQSQMGLLPKLSLSMKQTPLSGSGWCVMLTSGKFMVWGKIVNFGPLLEADLPIITAGIWDTARQTLTGKNTLRLSLGQNL